MISRIPAKLNLIGVSYCCSILFWWVECLENNAMEQNGIIDWNYIKDSFSDCESISIYGRIWELRIG